MTSSRARSCHVVWDANNIMVHVRKVFDESFPVKKKVLQLSITCCMLKWTSPPLVVVFFYVAVSKTPNKSFPYEALLVAFTMSFHNCMISLIDLEMAI
jgi:hypothetical protein